MRGLTFPIIRRRPGLLDKLAQHNEAQKPATLLRSAQLPLRSLVS